jgi:hypothetical protein
VVVEMGLTVTTVPLVADRFPGVMTPVPLAKTAVRVEVPPAVIAAGFATNLEIDGPGRAPFTVTVAAWVTVVPEAPVTVRV